MSPRHSEELRATLASVYEDRNAAVVLLARLAAAVGWQVHMAADPEAPRWPVIYVETPDGQVSWHLPELLAWAELPELMVQLGSGPAWDGHASGEKNRRVLEAARRLGSQGRA